MCKPLKRGAKASEAFRVSKHTYDRVLTDYASQYSCYTQMIETNVCVCPKGTIDYQCATETYTKCAINVTSPAFYKGCEDKEDSFYYLYSVPGFSPCYPQNFTQSINVEFELTCKDINQNGLVVT